MTRHLASRRRLFRHHVRVEVGRPPDRLAGVVDDEVQSVAGRDQVAAEGFDARRVAQIQPEDLEPVSPVAEVGFLRVASSGVARKAGRDDEMCAGSEEDQSGLVSDLHASTGQQRHASAQIRELGARGEVDVGAAGAQLVVEGVEGRVRGLADVADTAHRGTFGVRRSTFVVGQFGRSWFVVRRRSSFVVRRRLAVDVSRLERRRRKHVWGGDAGRRRSERIPVSFNTASSCLTRSALAAFRRLRFARGSAVDSAAIAWCSRRRSSAESWSSIRQSAARHSSSSSDGTDLLDERGGRRKGWRFCRRHRWKGSRKAANRSRPFEGLRAVLRVVEGRVEGAAAQSGVCSLHAYDRLHCWCSSSLSPSQRSHKATGSSRRCSNAPT